MEVGSLLGFFCEDSHKDWGGGVSRSPGFVTATPNRELSLDCELRHADRYQSYRLLTISVRQAAVAAQRTMTFQYGRPLERHSERQVLKSFLTQTFPLCGATCYILLSRAMTQLFNGVNFVYRSVEVYLTFCSYLRVLVRIRNVYNGGRY